MDREVGRRGDHGASDGVDFDGVNLRRWFGKTLTAILDELGLDKVDVIGHSQGAMLGMFLALTNPSGSAPSLRSGRRPSPSAPRCPRYESWLVRALAHYCSGCRNPARCIARSSPTRSVGPQSMRCPPR